MVSEFVLAFDSVQRRFGYYVCPVAAGRVSSNFWPTLCCSRTDCGFWINFRYVILSAVFRSTTTTTVVWSGLPLSSGLPLTVVIANLGDPGPLRTFHCTLVFFVYDGLFKWKTLKPTLANAILKIAFVRLMLHLIHLRCLHESAPVALCVPLF